MDLATGWLMVEIENTTNGKDEKKILEDDMKQKTVDTIIDKKDGL